VPAVLVPRVDRRPVRLNRVLIREQREKHPLLSPAVQLVEDEQHRLAIVARQALELIGRWDLHPRPVSLRSSSRANSSSESSEYECFTVASMRSMNIPKYFAIFSRAEFLSQSLTLCTYSIG